MPRFLSVAQPGGAPRPIYGVLAGVTTKRLVVSALPGLRPDGTMPEGLEAQAAQAFDNLASMIAASGLRREDIVAVSAYVAAPNAKATVDRAATAKLGGSRPAPAIREVISLSQTGSVIEIDAEAIAD